MFWKAFGAAILILWAGPAAADEGMWPFDQAPVAQVRAALGVDLDAGWLDHLRGASVRLTTGCSASIVSPEGLVLTNHHCIVACVQHLSAPNRDYVRDGFVIDGRAEERSCPGEQAEVLVAITEVTDAIFAAGKGKLGQDFVDARGAAIAVAEAAACGGDARFRCQVISFYEGGQYKVYKYRRYDDVRLVFAPEFDAAFFGGDPDNFNFPRYDLDCAFLRLYEDGKPAVTPDFLAWSSTAPAAGDPWADIELAQKVYARQFTVWRQLEASAGGGSDLYRYARELVRAAAERTKPSGQRLPEFADSRLPLLGKVVLDPKPVEPALDRLYLEFWLSKTRELLGADAPAVTDLIGKESPEELADRLIAGSKLADPAVRRALWQGGIAAIVASDDPMIRFVVATDPVARAARDVWEEEVTGPVTLASERIARARYMLSGPGLYPDATFSLRLSYGKVAGWTYQGEDTQPFTTFAGLFGRATGAPPYRLPARWTAAEGALGAGTVLDFATTNDIIGGSSGSPVVNAKGQIVGTAFDGNIHSIAGDFSYDGALNRTIVVSTVAITEALEKVYGRAALVKELQGGSGI